MRRVLSCLAAVVVAASLLGPSPVRAGEAQISDPKGDHPADFADLTAVNLSVRTLEGREYLDVTFTLAGPITDANRAVMTGYYFKATLADCELSVWLNAYPSAVGPAGIPIGSPHAKCAGLNADVPGGYQYQGSTVTVRVGLGDLPGVVKGATLTNLRAHTAWLQGAINTGGAIGDQASSGKPWTIG